ncbi:hypothetical protein GEMRC1_000681 [Eukaryota sp. GEM-RC1]
MSNLSSSEDECTQLPSDTDVEELPTDQILILPSTPRSDLELLSPETPSANSSAKSDVSPYCEDTKWKVNTAEKRWRNPTSTRTIRLHLLSCHSNYHTKVEKSGLDLNLKPKELSAERKLNVIIGYILDTKQPLCIVDKASFKIIII